MQNGGQGSVVRDQLPIQRLSELLRRFRVAGGLTKRERENLRAEVMGWQGRVVEGGRGVWRLIVDRGPLPPKQSLDGAPRLWGTHIARD